MNQDEIIAMARQSGAIPVHRDPKNKALVGNENIKAFAKLVAAKEREACAEMCDTYEDWSGPWGQYDNLYAAIESANEIAKAIRARGEA